MTRCSKLKFPVSSWWSEFIFKDFSWWTEDSLSLIYLILVFCCFDTVQTPWLNIKTSFTMSSIDFWKKNNVLHCMFYWDVECKLIFLHWGQRVIWSFRRFFLLESKSFSSTRIGLRTDHSRSISPQVSMTFSLILSHYLLFISILFGALIFHATSLISLDKYVLNAPCHLAFSFPENFLYPKFF